MNKKQIWIVDDEEALANCYSNLLKDDFHAQVFNNAEAAIAAFEKAELPDLILSDLRMPSTDGFALLEKIRAKNEKLPVLLMSALANKEDFDRAKSMGAAGLLEKPIPPTDLSTAIHQAIRLREIQSVEEEIIRLLQEHSELAEKLLSKSIERCIQAETLAEAHGLFPYRDRSEKKKYLETIYRENAMHKDLEKLKSKTKFALEAKDRLIEKEKLNQDSFLSWEKESNSFPKLKA